MRTKVVSLFILFQELSNKKVKELRPKLTKIVSSGVLPLSRVCTVMDSAKDYDVRRDAR